MKGVFTNLLIIFSILLIGCSTIQKIDSKLVQNNFDKVYVKTSNFELLTCQKINKPGAILRIYIEGDGNAWKTRTVLSDDPTPRNPLALYLAMEDSSQNIVYIARPGQFPKDGYEKVDSVYWSDKRFAKEVIESFNEVIDKIKKNAKANKIELIGYSGGGGIAVLVASGRNNVVSIRTVAGNLDHQALCKYHKASLLEGSLNPIDYAIRVKDIPQRHFVGSKDNIVPPFIVHASSNIIFYGFYIMVCFAFYHFNIFI